jgi:predicted acyl esterase
MATEMKSLNKCTGIEALILLLLVAASAKAQQQSGEIRTGVFAGPVIGLKYQTPTLSGVTNEKGQFQCRDGEVMVFSVGGIVLGNWQCADRITLAHLDPDVAGNIAKMNGYRLTNMARFVQSLDEDGIVENGVTITPKTHEIISNRRINFNISEAQFTESGRAGEVHQLLGQLNDQASGVFTADRPRGLRSAAAARNEIRRNIRGIIKVKDVKVPMRDGSFLYADVYRPDDNEKHPVIMTLSIYGKESFRGCVCNPADYERHEEIEDEFFSGNPGNDRYENHESANTVDFVPYGYATMRVDGRGTCNSPGEQYPFSYQEAKDYYDAIEWAGVQPWSSGNVGTYGYSYTGWNQPPMASLQPPHLKAMMPLSSDFKYLEDVIYIGGIYNEGFAKAWWHGGAREVCRVRKEDYDQLWRAEGGFYDAAVNGPTGSLWMDPDISKVVVPQWTEMPTTHNGNIHQRGTSEQFIRSGTPLKDKKLILAKANWMADGYARVAEQRAFFDYWLKGIKNGIMDTPPVRAYIRAANGSGYYQYFDNWPAPQTKYTKLYLDASPSNWAGDRQRNDFLRLSQTPPSVEKSKTYSADVDTGSDFPSRAGLQPCWATGISFVTDPMPEDMVLAGYMKLVVWVSSTSSDMDVVTSFRVMDENNREVNFPSPNSETMQVPSGQIFPGFWGAMRVGHRKLDPKWSTDWRPVYTYTKTDYQPLKKGEIVQTQVELWPDTALVKKGQRIRLDVQPHGSCGRLQLAYDASYHKGAENTIYSGPNHASYLQIPVIPPTGNGRDSANATK